MLAFRQAFRRDHPRIRGEHNSNVLTEMLTCGSSPHTRGAHARLPAREPLRRIIPAYAGSTVAQIPGKIVKADHPRIRGEHSVRHSKSVSLSGSSPHTRGAPGMPLPAVAAGGIIPAYAGSTLPKPIQ